jgi:hypothetical protein
MTWQRSLLSRRELLAAMASRKRELCAREIAHLVGKNQSSVHQLLVALEVDGCVEGHRAPHGHVTYWRPTGKPLPDLLTSTGDAQTSIATGARFDHRLLAQAMGLMVKAA